MLKRMQIMIPEELYKSLREESFSSHTSMSKIIVEKLQGSISKNRGNESLLEHLGHSNTPTSGGFLKKKFEESMGPIVGSGVEKPVKFNGSHTPQAKAISKFKKRITLSKEMEEKILNHNEIGSPRGELDPNNYT